MGLVARYRETMNMSSLCLIAATSASLLSWSLTFAYSDVIHCTLRETKVDGNPNNNKICGRLISIDGESANGVSTFPISVAVSNSFLT